MRQDKDISDPTKVKGHSHQMNHTSDLRVHAFKIGTFKRINRDTIPLTSAPPLSANLHLTLSLDQDGFLILVTQFVL